MTLGPRHAWQLAVLLSCIAGCAGGQSGTDHGGTLQPCPEVRTRDVAYDVMTTLGSAAQVRASAEESLRYATEIALSWTSEVGASTTLAIEVIAWGELATVSESGVPSCGEQKLLVPATLRFVTEDGLLDQTIAGTWNGAQWTGSYEEIEVSVVAADDRVSGALQARSGVLAHFDSMQLEVAAEVIYTPPATSEAACRAVAPTEDSYRAFSSNEALIGALAGTWILCTSTSTNTPEHDGLVIDAGGTWKHIVAHEGGFIEQLGFGSQGAFTVFDLTDYNGPNSRQLTFVRFMNDYAFSTDRGTLRLTAVEGPQRYDNTYVRSDLVVGPPQPEHAVGERAGLAACESREAFVHGFDSVDALRDTLSGAWTFCNGGLRAGAAGIAFAADGSYRHLDASGTTIATGRYELHDTSMMNGPGMTQVNLTDDDLRADGRTRDYLMPGPLLSEAPLKLALGDGSVLSALP